MSGLLGKQLSCTGCKKDHVIPMGEDAFHVRNQPVGKPVAYFCEAAFKKIPKRHRYDREQAREKQARGTVAIYDFMATSPFCYVPRPLFARRLPRVEKKLLLER